MVFLRLRVNVLPREETGVYSFLLPVENPESVTISALKSMIQEEFHIWHPQAEPLNIGFMVDQKHPDYRFLDSRSAADIFVNKGILKADNSDQDAIVCVFQESTNHGAVSTHASRQVQNCPMARDTTSTVQLGEPATPAVISSSAPAFDVDMFDFIGLESETSRATPSRQLQEADSIETFQRTEQGFLESCRSLPNPEIENPSKCSSKQKPGTNRKGGQHSSSLQGTRAGKEKKDVATLLGPGSYQTIRNVEVPVDIDDNDEDNTVAPRGKKRAASFQPETHTYEMSGALPPTEATPAASTHTTPSRRPQSKKTIPEVQSPPSVTLEKPIPPPRTKITSHFPESMTKSMMNGILDNSAKETALKSARASGATDDHLRQIELVHKFASAYNDAIEDGKSKKKIEKYRSEWERHNKALLEMTTKKTAASEVHTLPRANNGQFIRKFSQVSSPFVTVTPKRTSKTTPSSRVRRSASGGGSSDEYEGPSLVDPGKSSVSTRSQKRRRLSKK
ncbi:hypothetical protein FQN54_007126 [Arachnomyces sp. PD_36]|nr:hypothetical protein FQN54_007126 [Arachnomyces sp. PD_36]